MLSAFSVLNCIVNHCTSSWEDLTAAPPGSPLAFPLIYSLIHLYCCHMASLSLTPPSPTPSIIPLFLPPLSHISELLILGASQSKHAPQFPVRSSLPPSYFSFPFLLSPLLFLLCCNRAPLLHRLCCSSLPRSAQIRSCHRQRLMHP